jgi:4-hydroxy-tetrahydrodipicolinate reductase
VGALRIAIGGAAGRMGASLARAIAAESGLALVGAVGRPGAASIGTAIGAAGVRIEADVASAAATADVWIDFSVPAATLGALVALAKTGARAAIIGTTGLDEAGERAIADAARRIAIVKSGNFSLGVNVLAALVRQAAARLGPEWDIEIVETHHRRKIDAPSGTALLLGEAAAEARGEALSALRLKPREGITGARPGGGVGIASLRGGGVIGEHDVLFLAEEEYIRLSHVALDRALFARGALAAARWAADKPPGLYSMRDVLGL